MKMNRFLYTENIAAREWIRDRREADRRGDTHHERFIGAFAPQLEGIFVFDSRVCRTGIL
ncbi:hypothetical protein PAT3040_03825 [Paenibacillus agaridevorans]|uniref:Uncharacterized protein n=1 Tax=Paenibacillus agaridevorans TaxID=171404 RepID=A0A2R5ER39_9BACL|nr:hypothetical protein PAT3040_03825 [Paenibacillus agaridevorans]